VSFPRVCARNETLGLTTSAAPDVATVVTFIVQISGVGADVNLTSIVAFWNSFVNTLNIPPPKSAWYVTESNVEVMNSTNRRFSASARRLLSASVSVQLTIATSDRSVGSNVSSSVSSVSSSSLLQLLQTFLPAATALAATSSIPPAPPPLGQTLTGRPDSGCFSVNGDLLHAGPCTPEEAANGKGSGQIVCYSTSGVFLNFGACNSSAVGGSGMRSAGCFTPEHEMVRESPCTGKETARGDVTVRSSCWAGETVLAGGQCTGAGTTAPHTAGCFDKTGRIIHKGPCTAAERSLDPASYVNNLAVCLSATHQILHDGFCSPYELSSIDAQTVSSTAACLNAQGQMLHLGPCVPGMESVTEGGATACVNSAGYLLYRGPCMGSPEGSTVLDGTLCLTAGGTLHNWGRCVTNVSQGAQPGTYEDSPPLGCFKPPDLTLGHVGRCFPFEERLGHISGIALCFPPVPVTNEPSSAHQTTGLNVSNSSTDHIICVPINATNATNATYATNKTNSTNATDEYQWYKWINGTQYMCSIAKETSFASNANVSNVSNSSNSSNHTAGGGRRLLMHPANGSNSSNSTNSTNGTSLMDQTGSGTPITAVAPGSSTSQIPTPGSSTLQIRTQGPPPSVGICSATHQAQGFMTGMPGSACYHLDGTPHHNPVIEPGTWHEGPCNPTEAAQGLVTVVRWHERPHDKGICYVPNGVFGHKAIAGCFYIVAVHPRHQSGGHSPSIRVELMFSENMQAGTGDIVFRDVLSQRMILRLPVNSEKVTFQESRVVIESGIYFPEGEIGVEMGSGVIETESGYAFDGLVDGDYRFHVQAQRNRPIATGLRYLQLGVWAAGRGSNCHYILSGIECEMEDCIAMVKPVGDGCGELHAAQPRVISYQAFQTILEHNSEHQGQVMGTTLVYGQNEVWPPGTAIADFPPL